MTDESAPGDTAPGERTRRALGKIGDRKTVELVIGQALELSARRDVTAGLTSCVSYEPYGYARPLANAVTAQLCVGRLDEVLATVEQIDDLVENYDPTKSPFPRATRCRHRVGAATHAGHRPGDAAGSEGSGFLR